MKKYLILWFLLFGTLKVLPQSNWQGKFEQLRTQLPTPNEFRTASGTPGESYWQQKVDYKIQVTLDDVNQQINGQAGVTYFNESPHELPYIWFQLDQNMRNSDSDKRATKTGKISGTMTPTDFQQYEKQDKEVEGYNIEWVRSATGYELNYTINKTMMRVDLPKPLPPGQSIALWLAWNYKLNNRLIDKEARSGYEYFPEDDNYMYTVAQFFPRAAVYSDFEGWQNKQFMGESEFATNFGDYQVDITVPADMIVAATGTLMNPSEVLTKDQVSRLDKAKSTYDKPVLIVTAGEAKRNEPLRSRKLKRWHFDANNVRDFAFAASRKFVWDAMAVDVGENDAIAMSFYTKESNQLWKKYATEATAHTIRFYSKYLFEYPYPVAISVNSANQGMEYPMINFSGGRPEGDKYNENDANTLISLLIHEVGHNYFPMIVNTDERSLFWMDEGINSFLQYLAEQDWMWGYPSKRGPAEKVIPYMNGQHGAFRPIMSDPEHFVSKYGNAYIRPATALNILRNLVMGPELFDFAFKTYANTWKYKHPTYADFFRIMEDASAVDLDWFWKEWFFSTDHVDVAIESIKWYRLSDSRSVIPSENLMEINSEPYTFNYKPSSPGEFIEKIDDQKFKENMSALNYYEVTFDNKGGLVTPLVLEWKYTDTSTEVEIIPAQIWRRNERTATKIFVKEKKVVSLRLDPDQMTADVDTKNNFFPRLEP
ncbi:MAG: M1 family metallopeptidase [Bacteroidota bacterium]